MSFLSKLGSIILKGFGLALPLLTGAGQHVPGAAPVVTKIVDFIEQLAPIIIMVETVGQLQGIQGADKARAAGPLIGQVILQSAFMAGKKIEKPDLFKAGCVNIAGGVADVLNSLRAEDAKEKIP